MSRLKNIIHEVHRRSLWQVLAIYAGASWVVFEVVQTLTEGLGLPDWVPPFAFVLLLIGFPIVMATAFVQEGISGPAAAPAEATEPPPGETEAPAGAPAVTEVRPEPPAARRLFTWRNAILGGVAAFALLGVLTSGYMAMRLLGIGPIGSLVAAGVLDERDRIILADFQDNAGDPLLARAATEAFRVDLEQSPLVTLADPAYVAGVVARMELESDVPLDLDRAREAAVREGVKAVIGGEIVSAGAGYVLSARLVSAADGGVLASSRETAKDSTEVLTAIDALSKKLRERIGESLKTIRNDPPLERVTTGSLAALRLYSQAVHATEVEGDHDRGIALLEEAVSLDSAFAMAWRKLGVAYANVGLSDTRQIEALTRAFQHRDRLTDRERYMTAGTYHWLVSNQHNQAVTAFTTLLEAYPDETRALNNLAAIHNTLREFEKAETVAARALAIDSTAYLHYVNMADARIGQTEFARADSVVDRMAEVLPDNPWTHFSRVQLAAARGDLDAAESHARQTRELMTGSGLWRAAMDWTLNRLTLSRGRLAEAEAYMRESMATNEGIGLRDRYLESAAFLAYLEARFRGRPERAIAEIDRALIRIPLDSLAPLDRPYIDLARAYAVAGRPESGAALLDEYEAVVDPAVRRRDEFWLHGARGLVALAAGRIDEAIGQLEEFADGRDNFCGYCALPELARAYEMAGQPDTAIALYERYVGSPWAWRFAHDADHLAHSYERLGILYEARGDTEKAMLSYGRFAELWKDADPELQPRVEAARRAIQALSSDQ